MLGRSDRLRPHTIQGAETRNMATSTRARRSRQTAILQNLVETALDDMKAVDVKVLDLAGLTDFADTMIVASGNSDRHVRSIADRVIERVRSAGVKPLGVEGQREGEWVLVDLNDVVVHVMLPRVRELYGLERLWEAPEPQAAVASRRGRRRPPQ
jgi:ribosome-associated protein